MEEIQGDKDDYISRIAVEMVAQYVKGLLSVTTLKELIWLELHKEVHDEQQEEYIKQGLYKRIAQRICSRVLYTAWRSSNSYLKECAFANMRH